MYGKSKSKGKGGKTATVPGSGKRRIAAKSSGCYKGNAGGMPNVKIGGGTIRRSR